MKCFEIEQQIESFVDGELGAFHTKQVEQHLETCESCATELERLKTVGNLLKLNLPSAPPAELVEMDARVLAAFRAHRGSEKEKSKPAGLWALVGGYFMIPKPVFALILAACAVVCGLAFQLGKLNGQSTGQNISPQIVEKSPDIVPSPNIPDTPAEPPIVKVLKVPVIRERLVVKTIYRDIAGTRTTPTNPTTAKSVEPIAPVNHVVNRGYRTDLDLSIYQPVAEMKLKIVN